MVEREDQKSHNRLESKARKIRKSASEMMQTCVMGRERGLETLWPCCEIYISPYELHI
jgi:hypothetical protein